MKTIIYTLIFILGSISGQVNAQEIIKIGASLGLSGKYQEMSDMNKKGLELWAEIVNSRGGLAGRTIQLKIYDDKSNPETAKQLYQKLILEDQVDLLFGPYSSTITAAILPIAEQYGYPLIFLGAAADSLWSHGYKNAFGAFTPASRYTLGFLEMLAKRGINDIAIVFADDNFSSNIAYGAKDWGEQFGLQVKFFKKFKKGTRDLSEIALQAKATLASALVVCGHYDESVDMLKAIKKEGWQPKAYFATVGPAMETFQEELKDDASLAFSSSQWEPSVLYTQNDHDIFLKPFVEKYNQQPAYHAAQAFAAGQILEAAVVKAKSFDRDKIRDNLLSMDAMNIMGRYKVDSTGKQIGHFQLTIQRQNGKKEIVWPETKATSKAIFR